MRKSSQDDSTTDVDARIYYEWCLGDCANEGIRAKADIRSIRGKHNGNGTDDSNKNPKEISLQTFKSLS